MPAPISSSGKTNRSMLKMLASTRTPIASRIKPIARPRRLGAGCGWTGALVAYETLLLRELGYGGSAPPQGDFAAALKAMDRLAGPLDHYLLADRRGDVMAARSRLRGLLGRI